MAQLYLDRLAHLIVNTNWDSLPAKVQHAVRRVFMDALGANLRGSEEPENMRLGDFYEQMSGSARNARPFPQPAR